MFVVVWIYCITFYFMHWVSIFKVYWVNLDIFPHCFLFLHSPDGQRFQWFCVWAVTECSLCHSSHCWCQSVPHRGAAFAVASWCRKGGGGRCLPATGEPRPCYSGMCRGCGANSNRSGSARNPGPAAGRAEGGARRGDGARLADLLRRRKMAAQSQRADLHPSLLLQLLRAQGARAGQKRTREEKEAKVHHSVNGKHGEVWAGMTGELKLRLTLCKVCVFVQCLRFQL